jgi:hypothetical protein
LPNPAPAQEPERERDILLIGLTGSGKSNFFDAARTDVRLIDLWRTPIPWVPPGFLSAETKYVVLDHFERGFSETVTRLERLSLVEHLVNIEKPRRQVIVLSAVDPLEWVTSRASLGRLLPEQYTKEEAEAFKEEIERWAAVLRFFTRMDTKPDDDRKLTGGEDRIDSDGLEWINRECKPTFGLHLIGQHLIANLPPRNPLFTVEELRIEIRERAEAYYEHLWANLTLEERLTLADAARDQLANPGSLRTVRQLLRKGLLVTAPHFGVMNETFRDFIRSEPRLRELERLEGEAAFYSGSKAFTTAAAFGGFGLVLLLLFTQRELLPSSIGVLTAIVGGLSVLLRLWELARGKPRTAFGEDFT